MKNCLLRLCPTAVLVALTCVVSSVNGDEPVKTPPAASPRSDYVPTPDPVNTGRYLVGSIMCPLWHGQKAWKPIASFPDRKPLLGWYDEGDPEVTDWEIKWALDHGISFFMPCWYREKTNLGQQPIRSLQEHWLTEGLPKSRYGRQFKFALMWENTNAAACGVASEADLLEHLLPYWIERFFRQPNYLLVDGKPVLAIYGPGQLVKQLGGEAQATVAFQKMRVQCQKAGFPGLILLGQYCWRTGQDPHPQMQRLGFDYSFAYHWPTFAGPKYMPTGPQPDPEQILDGQERCWRNEPREGLPNIPTVSMGWDSAPWGFSCTRTQWRLTPAQFKTACQRARSVLDERPGSGLESRMVLIDNWNEYGEGHYVFPTRQYRFGYLDAIRAVFAPNAARHSDLVPEEIGRGPYDSLWRSGEMPPKH